MGAHSIPVATQQTKVGEYLRLLDEASKWLAQSQVITADATADLSGAAYFVLDANAGAVDLDLPYPGAEADNSHRMVLVACRSNAGGAATVTPFGKSAVALSEGSAIAWISDDLEWYQLG